MCQAITKAGAPCRRKGEPFCAAHVDLAERTNLEAFDELVAGLRRRDALMAPGPLVELGRTLASAVDVGSDEVRCPQCKASVFATQNAALVKQYRELVERLAADDSRDDDADIWEQFQNAARNS